MKKIMLLEEGLYNAPGNIYWKNADGIYLGCNYINAKALGLNSPDDIIGKTDFDLAWGKEALTYRKNDLCVIDSRTSEIVEEVAPLPNRTVIYLSQKMPLIDKDCNVVGVLGISVDITIKRHLESSTIRNIVPANSVLEPLSDRELEVMKLLILGKKIRDISVMLRVSVQAVHTYRNRIFKKLSVTNDIELMHVIIRNNLQHLIGPYLK